MGLPPANSYTVIMVFISLKTDSSSNQVAEAFINNIIKLRGIPHSIVSDREKVIISHFSQHLFKS